MEKTNFKKLVSLSLAAMLCASVPAISANGAFATDGAPAGGGEPVPVEDNSFVVEETAAIRVSDPSGMRFYANIGADLVDDVQSADEFGFLIFPHAYLAEDENAGKADWQVKGIDGNAEYGLWDYVKVSTTEMDGLIYQRETDGKYCVNGVLHTVVDETMEFAAIAYYVKDGEPVYADFNKDFSRSLSYVAKWAYISEPAKRNAIKSTFDWLNTDEFTINSGKEMQMLSNAVSEENPCAGLSFTLSKTIAVDGSTFTPVPAEFAGTWNWNNYAVLVVADEDDTTDDERAFVSDEYNVVASRAAATSKYYYHGGVVVRSSTFIDAATTAFNNKKGEAVVTTQYTENVAAQASVTGTEEYYENYTGNAAYFAVDIDGSASQVSAYYRVKTNGWHVPYKKNATTIESLTGDRSYDELNAVRELYSAVTIRFYVYFKSNNAKYTSWGSTGGFVNAFGWNSSSTIPKGYWISRTLTIDELVLACITGAENFGYQVATEYYTELNIGRMFFKTSKNADTAYFYIGDCVFVK